MLLSAACTKEPEKKPENNTDNPKSTPTELQGTVTPGETPSGKNPGSYTMVKYEMSNGERKKAEVYELDLNEQGRKSREYQWYASRFGKEAIEEVLYEYDEHGRVVTEKWHFDGEYYGGASLSVNVYEYDGETERVIRRTSYDDKGNAEQVTEKRYKDGKEVYEKTVSADGTVTSICESTYDGYGNRISFNVEESTPSQRYVTEYNPAERLATEYYVEDWSEGVSTRTKWGETYYDTSGRITCKKYFSTDENGATVEDRTIVFSYKDGRTPVKSTAHTSYGYVCEREFDDEGKVLRAEEYELTSPDSVREVIYDWNYTDPELPGKEILRVTWRSLDRSLNEPDQAYREEENRYIITDRRDLKKVYATEDESAKMTCYDDIFIAVPYISSHEILEMVEYSDVRYYSEDDIEIRIQSGFDEKGTLISKDYYNSGRTEHSEYDDHGNLVKKVIKDADGNETSTEYEYTYY